MKLKTQTIRLIDVFVLGPLLIVTGARAARGRISDIESAALIFAGIATILFNLQNWRAVRGQSEPASEGL